MSKLRIAGTIDESIVDGPGIRYVVFVQGCPHHCEGCHNPETHDFNGGRIIDTDNILAEIDANPLITGVTFSGGEPFCQAEALCDLAQEVKARNLHLLIYTGYTFKHLVHASAETRNYAVYDLLSLADAIVDGPFILAERDLTLPFWGSRNQQYIKIRKEHPYGI